MCNPVAFAVASTALSAAQTVSQAKAARKAASQQARIAEENAQTARQEAASQARRQRRLGERQRAGFRARLGTSGVVGVGSPVDALATAAMDTELDALNLWRQGDLRARQSVLERNNAVFAGRQARNQAISSLGRSLLGTAGSLFSTKAAPASAPRRPITFIDPAEAGEF